MEVVAMADPATSMLLSSLAPFVYTFPNPVSCAPLHHAHCRRERPIYIYVLTTTTTTTTKTTTTATTSTLITAINPSSVCLWGGHCGWDITFLLSMSDRPRQTLGLFSTALRNPSSNASGQQSSTLLSRVEAKRAELENLQQLRDTSALLALRMQVLEQKLSTLRDGTEGLLLCVPLRLWHLWLIIWQLLLA